MDCIHGCQMNVTPLKKETEMVSKNHRNAFSRALVLAILALTVLSAAPEAEAVPITIEGTEFPLFTPIDDEYASSGVLFSSNMPFATLSGIGGRTGIIGTDPGSNPAFGFAQFNAPIRAIFVDPTDGVTPSTVTGTVSAVWGDGGGDLDLMRMRLFDLGGNLIDTVLSQTNTFTTISFTGMGIHSVLFDQQPGAAFASDTFLDSFSFDMPMAAAAPEPTTLWLMGLGLSSLAARARKNRR